ncbi:hypothetical protein VPFG_00352 [Vibrio phage nt-1]|uniref:Uncharacterized protein n=1 Tax=Vibrio phage nt-1 TaxID=115992 RepID=R9TFV7_9CAUD|nr:hypothetical protein VPFG_00352 [Vibrio phage nt-1]AGN30349.1 hypothetical protein VPFG_00352 [Vibrio phage nt-1]
MITHDQLSQKINERERDLNIVLNKHYRDACELSFTEALKEDITFPFTISVPIHASDKDKRGASIVRSLLDAHGYRNVRTQYETSGVINIEIYENSAMMIRHPKFN